VNVGTVTEPPRLGLEEPTKGRTAVV